MSDFTVEATVRAVDGGDWSLLHRILDLVPSAVLIADASEPLLIFSVESESPTRAIMFVDGIANLVGVEIVSGSVQPTPDVDVEPEERCRPEAGDGDDVSTRAQRAVIAWVESVPSFRGSLTREGNVEFAH